MTEFGCPREEELLEALQASRWPACENGLREHVSGCASCADLLAVATPLLDAHAALVQNAAVPSSAIVWWRAQMRSRREAAERASQPISVLFGIALACAAGLLATALGVFVPTFRRAIGWTVETITPWSAASLPLPGDLSSPLVLALAAAIGVCLLAAPLALYFTLRED